jgi:hypothetical protein
MHERVATRITAIVTNPFGPMYENEIAKIFGLAIDELDSYEFWYAYNREGTDDALQRAREAARTALDIDGQNLLANLAMAGVHYSRGDLDGGALDSGPAVDREARHGTQRGWS